MSEEINVQQNHKEHGSIMQALAIAALVVALGAMAFVQIGMKHEQERTNAALTDLNEKNQAKLDAMEQRTAALEQDAAALHALGIDATSAIKDTQHRLAVTNATTAKKFNAALDDARQQSEKALGDLSAQSEQKFGSLNGDLTSVRGNLDETKGALTGVSEKLDKTVGDLGEASGVIAKNHEEFMALKRSGERDYAEFDLKKAKDFTRISDLGLRLTKTDAKNQKYTVSVKVADKQLEKRDKTALEPVQLYLPGGHKMVEIVVWDVDKDHVTGYVSAPKS
jgi:hypothetical protein